MIDAAFTDGDGHSYLFSGRKFVRFTGNSMTVDEGYPMLIEDHWQGLPADFRQGIDAALYLPDDGMTYFFSGTRYARFTGTTLNGTPTQLPGGWNGMPHDFAMDIGAAFYFPDYGRTYFFSGNQYARFNGTTMNPAYPAPLPGGWNGLPDVFAQGIDAAFHHPNGHSYFFSGNQYIRFNSTTMDSGPHPLPGEWQGLPPDFIGAGSPLLLANVKDGNVVVKDLDGNTVSPRQEFTLLPGVGITLRCVPDDLQIYQLRIYQDDDGEGKGKGDLLFDLTPGQSREIDDHDAVARCQKRGVKLIHRHEGAGPEARFWFGVRCQYRGSPIEWDPEVHDEKGGRFAFIQETPLGR